MTFPAGVSVSSGMPSRRVFVVAAMIYATGHISGAHINPAVTLGFALVRRISLRDAVVYWAAQMVGAVLAAALLRLLLGKVGIMGGHAITIDPAHAVGVEIALTFLLMFVIMAVATDKRAVRHAAALAIGATVTFDILVGGPLTGGSMNPARTTGPAILAANWQDLWVYWIGPPVGAALAAFPLYVAERREGVRRQWVVRTGGKDTCYAGMTVGVRIGVLMKSEHRRTRPAASPPGSSSPCPPRAGRCHIG